MTRSRATTATGSHTSGSDTSGGDRADAVRLSEALARLTKRTRRQLQLPLGVSTLSALATVMEQGPIRLGDLAVREGITPATLSRIVASLEQGGYARRIVDPEDGRAAFLEVTTGGRETIADIRHARADVLRDRLSDLGAEDREALFAALPALEALARD